MKNPKPGGGGGRGSSHKGSSSAASGGVEAQRTRWEPSSKNPPSDGDAASDSKPPKEDSAGPSAGPVKPPGGLGLPSASIPPAVHPLSATAPSPPPPTYGFQHLERRTIVLADGTVRSYFALPPDYPMEPRGDKLFHPGPVHGLDPSFPPPGQPFGHEGFREPPPFARGGVDYWSSLGLDGPAGSSLLKRKYGDEEFSWHRQQALQHGSSGVNPIGFPSGPVGDGSWRELQDDLRRRDLQDDLRRRELHEDTRPTKQIRLGGEGYDDLTSRRLRPDDNEPLVDQKALKNAFLRLSKTINDNPSQRKNYLEDGKNGPLQCVVCGRSSKEFKGIHDLIMHAYNSQNSDLRIDHLGLHKALCVLLGWNHDKVPDASKEYQLLSADDARANREDLILWPPTVIIHNTSTGKRKDGRMEGLGNKEMDVKLKELGFGGGKAKAVYGKEGHLGITAVKFPSSDVGLKGLRTWQTSLRKITVDVKDGRMFLSLVFQMRKTLTWLKWTGKLVRRRGSFMGIWQLSWILTSLSLI
ncbi:hypothetical protein HPP92_024002 [Vanilla planifolia]|uniref:XS domain-containing protein n=1 Tax=Vanilla planifolia TaxID=51239 RepID=A0A835PMR7_VANPL|nr:hypothetical protein HPP92_024002 [Vanilla planifolia]